MESLAPSRIFESHINMAPLSHTSTHTVTYQHSHCHIPALTLPHTRIHMSHTSTLTGYLVHCQAFIVHVQPRNNRELQSFIWHTVYLLITAVLLLGPGWLDGGKYGRLVSTAARCTSQKQAVAVSAEGQGALRPDNTDVSHFDAGRRMPGLW